MSTIASISSCLPGHFYTWSYVSEYYMDTYDFELVNADGAGWRLYGVVPLVKKKITWPASPNSDTPEEDAAKFEELSLRNGDWSYNQEFESFSDAEREHAFHLYLASPLVRVNFTSSQAWDEEHPAGTSLNDVLMCYTASPDEYIRSGYRKDMERLKEKMKVVTDSAGRKFGERLIARTGGTMTPIIGRFSEIDFRKYRLVGRYAYLFCLNSLITPPKGADLKMEVEFEDGRKVESTFVWPEK